MSNPSLLVLVFSAGASFCGAAEYGDDCTTSGCHDKFQKQAVIHAPVDSGSCDDCHEAVQGAEHKFSLTGKGADLCYQCHDRFEDKVIHYPVGEGECTSCHDPHASANKQLLLQASIGALCGDCHDDVMADLAYVHGPAAAGSCTACHESHASPHKSLLRSRGTDLCCSCHEDIKERIADSAHVHDPAADDCTSCHNAHGGSGATFLTSAVPELCVECHDDIGEAMEDSAVAHKPVATGASCTGCHEPHATARKHLLAADPAEMCLDCHEQAVKRGESKLPDMRAMLKENPQHHGPVADGACGDCHAVHGSPNFRLLSQAYPDRFYAPFDEKGYSLCFNCHDADLVLEARTDSATGFRNGDQNLHYVHVNRESKGRTCRACHEVHATTQPKQLRESVPFGDWSIPIGFKETDGGGLCNSGCHRPYRYDREKAIQNVPIPQPTLSASS